MAEAQPPALMRWPDLLSRPHPTGAIRIAYGSDPLQHGQLWLPAGKGPHRTVLMIHGGCWQSDIADASIMDWIAADLAKRGYAVWNIEYRGVDRPGGGYPGTFQDIAAATDLLRGIGPRYGLRTDRIVAVGHSAGGHLAFWAAGRHRLPQGSALRSAKPLPIVAAIGIGALPDLPMARDLPGNDCGVGSVPRLVGPVTAARPDPFVDTSADRLLPIGAGLTLVTGAADRIAPPSIAVSFVAKARARRQAVRSIEVPAQGHVELIAPETPAWAATVRAIEAAFAAR
ncbi:alpha/beta hydrolase [Sphingomonas sp. 1P06PA]|uniref:alpha/beta hydrolase n=1 Tax=Sphingomonas sp. 1P06PA TaxID=554121 RepID=UPI0039A4AD79